MSEGAEVGASDALGPGFVGEPVAEADSEGRAEPEGPPSPFGVALARAEPDAEGWGVALDEGEPDDAPGPSAAAPPRPGG
ncbi:hypothetical protein ACFQ10_18200 [Streptomyces indonesiensis]